MLPPSWRGKIRLPLLSIYWTINHPNHKRWQLFCKIKSNLLPTTFNSAQWTLNSRGMRIVWMRLQGHWIFSRKSVRNCMSMKYLQELSITISWRRICCWSWKTSRISRKKPIMWIRISKGFWTKLKRALACFKRRSSSTTISSIIGRNNYFNNFLLVA